MKSYLIYSRTFMKDFIKLRETIVRRLTSRQNVDGSPEETQKTKSGRLFDRVDSVAGNEDFGDLGAESLGHLAGSDVGDALQRQTNMDRVSGSQVVLDALYIKRRGFVIGAIERKAVTLRSKRSYNRHFIRN